MYQLPKCPYSWFSQALSLIWGCFFPVSILNFQTSFPKKKPTFLKNTGVLFFSWQYNGWKRNVPIQKSPLKIQIE